MHDEQGLAAVTAVTTVATVATVATRRLPPQAVASLREAFADELAERLPRLRAAVRSGRDDLLQQALRDAHSLASSAAVVGEGEASGAARAAEALLVARPPGAGAPTSLIDRVDELSAHLEGWRP